MDTFEKIKHTLLDSIGFKLALIIFLCLLLLIPASMVTVLIREREQRHDATIKNVTAIWGNTQIIGGPVLTLPCVKENKISQTGISTVPQYLHFLPEDLNISGTIEPEIRYRGIYKVITYQTLLHITGKFNVPDLEGLAVSPEELGKTGWLEIGITDLRGVNHNIQLKWGDSSLSVIPGIPDKQIFKSGVHALIKPDMMGATNFSFDLDLNGSHSLQFIPLGKETTAKLTSSWKTPSFSGAFLPDTRKISRTGFTAIWDILQLNRNFPQQWIDDQYQVDDSSFGVDLITAVDSYQKSMRSVKYAILFISLTFLIFFFAEVMTRIRIHPVHYLLVGIALCIFYSLLTALSEYIPFGAAYMLAGLVILLMITVYTFSLYGKITVTLTTSFTLAALYGFLYIILQLTDYSLLVGNIGLVIILGVVMYFSRRIDWYAPIKPAQKEQNQSEVSS